MRAIASCGVVACACTTAFLGHVRLTEPAVFAQSAAVTFADVSREAGLTFQHVNGASPQKHIAETMGSGSFSTSMPTAGSISSSWMVDR